MKITRSGVNKLVENELKMANEQFPHFRSDHEGIGVIGEEMYELKEILKVLEEDFEKLKLMVYTDKTEEKKQMVASHLTMMGVEVACEAIQVAAMGYKFNGSIIVRKEVEND